MGILDNLTFAEESHKPIGKMVDPHIKAKANFISALAEQKRFAKTLMEGEELPTRTRLMFWQFLGSYRFLPKVGFDPIIVMPDKPEIVCADLNEVIKVCDALIEATKSGELNEAIRETLKNRPPRGRAAAKAEMIAEPPMTDLDQESAPAKPAKARIKATA